MKDFKFEIVPGQTEHITFNGKKIRRPTLLIRVGTSAGTLSLSKKAFILGASLAACQVLDGLLTYVGLTLLGVHQEGNSFLRQLMHAYGMAPALFLTKFIAIGVVVFLTFHAHRRRWVRPLIFIAVLIYLALAVLPWTIIISKTVSESQATSQKTLSEE